MKKILLILMMIGLSVLSHAQTIDTLELSDLPDDVTLDDARNEVLQGNIERAVMMYKVVLLREQDKRTFRKGVSGDLLGEYAYALALSHNFEYALINIDRARQLGGDLIFYTSQVLKLMRMDTLAKVFEYSFAPSWINMKCETLYFRHVIPVREREPLDKNLLKTAYELSQKQQYVQALVILYQLEEDYPNAYIIQNISSQVWEKIGNLDMAEKQLKQAIKLMDSTDNVKDKQSYENHLAELEAKKAKKQNASNKHIGTMTYVGLSYYNKRLSYDVRYGKYEKNDNYGIKINRSLNFSSNSMVGQEITTYSLGYSVYSTIGFFVWGWGSNMTLTKMNKDFSITSSISLSAGLSFPNKTQSSSFDIMINGNLPYIKDSPFGTGFSYSISIGETFYF